MLSNENIKTWWSAPFTESIFKQSQAICMSALNTVFDDGLYTLNINAMEKMYPWYFSNEWLTWTNQLKGKYTVTNESTGIYFLFEYYEDRILYILTWL